jgi:hypothetical protein
MPPSDRSGTAARGSRASIGSHGRWRRSPSARISAVSSLDPPCSLAVQDWHVASAHAADRYGLPHAGLRRHSAHACGWSSRQEGLRPRRKYKHPSVANDARVLRYTRPLKGALSSTVHRGVRKPRPAPGRWPGASPLPLRTLSERTHMPM